MACNHFLPGDLPGGKAHKTAVILQLKAGYIQKKLIVSRQPIFTNLKSNTMKNNAKVRLARISGKHRVCFLPLVNILLIVKSCFAN